MSQVSSAAPVTGAQSTASPTTPRSTQAPVTTASAERTTQPASSEHPIASTSVEQEPPSAQPPSESEKASSQAPPDTETQAATTSLASSIASSTSPSTVVSTSTLVQGSTLAQGTSTTALGGSTVTSTPSSSFSSAATVSASHSRSSASSSSASSIPKDSENAGNIFDKDNKLFPLGVSVAVIAGLFLFVSLAVFSYRFVAKHRRKRKLRKATPSFLPALTDPHRSEMGSYKDDSGYVPMPETRPVIMDPAYAVPQVQYGYPAAYRPQPGKDDGDAQAQAHGLDGYEAYPLRPTERPASLTPGRRPLEHDQAGPPGEFAAYWDKHRTHASPARSDLPLSTSFGTGLSTHVYPPVQGGMAELPPAYLGDREEGSAKSGRTSSGLPNPFRRV
ncbi:hypothetical protein IAU60_003619 [Kwoniella sp. DSM 27419]